MALHGKCSAAASARRFSVSPSVRLVSQAVSRSINQSIIQPIVNHSINHSINQSISHGFKTRSSMAPVQIGKVVLLEEIAL